MPEESVAMMEAPAESPAESTSETTEAPSSTAETHETGEAPESGAEETSAEEQADLAAGDLYHAIKEKLKAAGLTVQEQKSLKKAIYKASRADELAGGDVDHLAQEREVYRGLAMEGEEAYTPEQIAGIALEDRRQLAGILADLDQGGTKLIEELIADRPDTFKTIASQAMDRWAELDNSAFSSYVANSTLNYLDKSRIPLQFAILDTFLPQMPQTAVSNQVFTAFEAIRKAFQGLESLAQNPFRTPSQPKAQATAPQTSTEEQRSFDNTRQEWNRTAGAGNEKVYTQELSRLASTRKLQLTEQERSEIRASVQEEFDARLGANRAYGNAMQAYIRAGNQKGYESRALSEATKLLPGIVGRHFNAIIEKRTAVKNGPKPPSSSVNGTRNSSPSARDGNGNLIQHLAGHPKTLGMEIDHMRSSWSMLQHNQAYVKGQKNMVQWPDKMRQRS